MEVAAGFDLPPALSTVALIVAIYVYMPWGGERLAPFEVWVGDTPGHQALRCDAEVREVVDDNGRSSDREEPSHGAWPTLIACAPRAYAHQRAYATIVGGASPTGHLFINEVEVYDAATLGAGGEAGGHTLGTHIPLPQQLFGQSVSEKVETEQSKAVVQPNSHLHTSLLHLPWPLQLLGQSSLTSRFSQAEPSQLSRH